MKQITIQEITNDKLQEVNDNLLDMIQEGNVALEIYSGCTPDTKFCQIKLIDVERAAVVMYDDDIMIEITSPEFMFVINLEYNEFNNIDMR